MSVTWDQITAASAGSFYNVTIAASGGPGSKSASITAGSAGAGVQWWILMRPAAGDAGTDLGTPSVIGACTVRLQITTSNANLTWSSLAWRVNCGAGGDVEITATSTLGISFGTTGVKTASVEATATFATPGSCGTATAETRFYIFGTSGASMVGVFIFTPTTTVTLPHTSGSSAPAASDVFNLASTKAGK